MEFTTMRIVLQPFQIGYSRSFVRAQCLIVERDGECELFVCHGRISRGPPEAIIALVERERCG
jgi:hypothetical protein